MSFTPEARDAAAAWKQRTPVLPDGARVQGAYVEGGKTYPFCLPLPYAAHNLLPDARDTALQRFAAAGIPWHAGTPQGPSSHLLSSQVQCCNALAPLVDRPEALRAWLGTVLPVAEVLPFGDPLCPEDHVVFEWIGHDNPLGEWPRSGGTRGSRNTSADAAVRYRTPEGSVELALIEWKYTESYPTDTPLSGGPGVLKQRHARYRPRFDEADGPLLDGVVPYEDLFVEPLYQLFRLQLLAHVTERQGHAERVRVVYAAPSRNTELWSSLPRMSHRRAGGRAIHDLRDLWPHLLRRPDRWAWLNTDDLVASSGPMSAAYRDRYGHQATGLTR